MVEELWKLKNKKVDIDFMSKEYNTSNFLCRLMANRDILDDKTIKSYINPVYSNLNNAKDMKDIEKACLLLKEKINLGKKIRIVGDYDVDGVISVFILYKALKRCDANIDYEIPDRINDGYGINKNIIKKAYDDGIDTIITCDNGIAAISETEYAKSLGITVIVTDHHDVAFTEEDGIRNSILPSADCILNPKQEDCNYTFKKICGAGVAFKLIEVLYESFEIKKEEVYEFIEFVAIATVCDVVDLVDENRIFVKNGLEMITNTNNIGLRELKKANNLEDKEITAYHLGFIIGPCINASGRLDSAKKGLELLLCEDINKAEILAKEIVDLNEERKEMTSEGLERAIKIIESSSIKDDTILVVYIHDIHESLAGIIAGRVKEKYNKPTIILTKSEEVVKGSCRSIEEYNIFEGLLSCKDILDKFGGHPMAAGLSLQEDKVEILRKRLNDTCNLTKEDLMKKISIDMSLPLESVTIPFGKGNSKPIFGVKNARIKKAILMGKNKNVLKLKILTNENIYIDAMIFNNIEEFEEKIIKKYGQDELDSLYNKNQNNLLMDFLFYPSINEWNQNKYIQIIVEGVR